MSVSNSIQWLPESLALFFSFCWLITITIASHISQQQTHTQTHIITINNWPPGPPLIKQKVEENKKQNKTQTTSSIGQQIGVIRKLLKNFRNTQQKKTTKKNINWNELKKKELHSKLNKVFVTKKYTTTAKKN